jgi:hypothetical protein
MKKPYALLFLFIVFLFLITSCAELEKLLGKKQIVQNVTKPAVPSWQPDKSKPFKVQGTVQNSATGEPIENVDVLATYTINCPTKACKPFTESITTTTDAKGFFKLDLYQQFWTIYFKKSTYNPTSTYFSKEQTQLENFSDVSISLQKGEYKQFDGTVRDQGKRIIIDRGAERFITSVNGVMQSFEYLVVVNDKQDPMYKELIINNNKFITFEGYVFVSSTKEGEIEIATFTAS